MEFEKHVLRDIERFQGVLGLHPGVDLQMIMLKGHLLIEEQLQAFIDGAVIDPTGLREGRFTFHQRLILAKALHRQPTRFGYGWVWESVKVLNSMRNQMAHNLAPSGFRERLAIFMAGIEPHLALPVTPGKGDEYEMAKFGFLLSVLNVGLSRLLRSEGRLPRTSPTTP